MQKHFRATINSLCLAIGNVEYSHGSSALLADDYLRRGGGVVAVRWKGPEQRRIQYSSQVIILEKGFANPRVSNENTSVIFPYFSQQVRIKLPYKQLLWAQAFPWHSQLVINMNYIDAIPNGFNSTVRQALEEIGLVVAGFRGELTQVPLDEVGVNGKKSTRLIASTS